MTLIVALQGKDGAVLSADSRGTVGDPRGLTAINDSHTKLFRLSRWCGIGLSGSSELAAKVVDDLHAQLAATKKEYADDIVEETRALARKRYDDWFMKFALPERPALVMTLVGFQKVEDQLVPRTYLLTSQLDFAPHLFPTGNCLTGVPQYAMYLMNRLFQPEMTVENLSRLAAYLIQETATQDPKVGGPIRIATITRDSGYAELEQKTVDDITKKNSEQNENLRRFFFGVDSPQKPKKGSKAHGRSKN